jgi:tetratricopeptide (TPR) repeat protein
MKKLILLITGVLFLMTLSLGSYKKLVSSRYQGYMLYDFNNNTRVFEFDDITNVDLNFPNISVTSLPIKYLAARYFLENDSIETAKKLIYQSIKDNPYIYAPEILLAKLYLSENKLDSALYYSKRAFYGLTNNNNHRDIYFDVLEELKDSISLDSAFFKIRNTNRSLDHWIDYIITRNEINSKPSAELLNIIDEMTVKFPYQDTIRLNGLKRMVQLEDKRYTRALYISERGNIEFQKENYKEAAKFYEAAITFDDQQYLYFENAAISYDNLKDYTKAEEYFNKVIYEFKTTDGKSEFFKGLMLIKNNNQLGCEYLEISARKNYIGIESGLRAIDVYRQLCQ